MTATISDRFFRQHQTVTLVSGARPYLAAAADRVAGMLKPWGVQVSIVNAAEVNHGREVSVEEAPALVGMAYGPAIKPGKEQNPEMVGFDIAGPTLLLGSPADNPLIASVARRNFLPYQPSATFPGAGRGMLAWLTDGITIGQDTVAVIGSDEAGISEAVGTLYDAVHGLDPLLPTTPPSRMEAMSATQARRQPEAPVAWEARLPSRADALQTLSGGHVAAMCADGTLAVLNNAGGKELWHRILPPAERYCLQASPDGKLLAAGSNTTLFIYTSGGKAVAETKIDDFARITSLGWSPDGKALLVGAEGGIVASVNADGTRRWTHGGEAFHDYVHAMLAYRAALVPWRKAEIGWSGGMKNTEKMSFPAVPAHPAPKTDTLDATSGGMRQCRRHACAGAYRCAWPAARPGDRRRRSHD